MYAEIGTSDLDAQCMSFIVVLYRKTSQKDRTAELMSQRQTKNAAQQFKHVNGSVWPVNTLAFRVVFFFLRRHGVCKGC